MNDFLKAMEFRHACKLFDAKKRIPKGNFGVILEAGRLSPSSFGLEPWHFLVIESAKVKEALKKAILNQPQVTTCSHLVILLSRKAKFFKQESGYLDKMFGRTAKDIKTVEAAKISFERFLHNNLEADTTNWAKMQAYIAGTNMMNAAAFLGIDSCPMEGFDAGELKKSLSKNVSEFDKKSYKIAFVIAFGYRVNESEEKVRCSIEEIATFVK
ncbi:MAG: NAD(P)H-dependent oxidoreductase [Campylobacteraceae bacterium]|jgi:nitroreductase|nr:NAD(P)H-dependent oxidoreductase [Campylobacteraceae bacterium]